MIDVRTGMPIDRYPIFTVHQDSMAMLSLFPAQAYGVPGVEKASERGVRWNLSHNELAACLIQHDRVIGSTTRSNGRNGGRERVGTCVGLARRRVVTPRAVPRYASTGIVALTTSPGFSTRGRLARPRRTSMRTFVRRVTYG